MNSRKSAMLGTTTAAYPVIQLESESGTVWGNVNDAECKDDDENLFSNLVKLLTTLC